MSDIYPEVIPTLGWDVTCHTVDCPNAGVTITVTADARAPYILCGVCGKQITDIKKAT